MVYRQPERSTYSGEWEQETAYCYGHILFEVCFKHGVRLDMEWIPRGLNDKANYISRISDFDDWKVNPQFSHGLMNCGVPIQWTVLPVLRTLSYLHSIVDSGARVLQRLMLLQ